MSNDKSKPVRSRQPERSGPGSEAAARREREAAALRANLRKRKEQARAREPASDKPERS
jgi:hypothetical protein